MQLQEIQQRVLEATAYANICLWWKEEMNAEFWGKEEIDSILREGDLRFRLWNVACGEMDLFILGNVRRVEWEGTFTA